MIIDLWNRGGGSSTYSESAGTAEYASTSDSTKLLEGGAGLPSDANAGDVVAVGSSLSKGLRSAGTTLGIYQYDGSDWNKVGEGGSVDNTILKSVSAFPQTAGKGDVVALVKNLYYTVMVPTTAITYSGNDILEITTSNYGSLVVNAYNDGGTNYLKFTSSDEEVMEAEGGNSTSLPTWDAAKTWAISYESEYLFINISENGPIPVFDANSITMNDCQAELADAGSNLGIYQYDGVWRWSQIGLTGPQGPQGPQGQDGAVGPQGATGAQGPAGEGGSGDSSFTHLDSLSGAGETGKTYEYEGRLLTWNPNDGNVAEWTNDISSSAFTANQGGAGLIYSMIPDGQIIFQYNLSSYAIRSLMYSGGTLYVMEGDTVISEFSGETFSLIPKGNGLPFIRGIHKNGYLGFSRVLGGAGTLEISGVWDGTVNGGHYELIDKYNHPYFYTNKSDATIPFVNQYGSVIGELGPVVKHYIGFNGVSTTKHMTYFYIQSKKKYTPDHIYAPTSGGTAGQILQSNGNAEPIWVDASTIQGAQGPQGPAGSGGGGSSYISDLQPLGINILEGNGVGYVSNDDGHGNPTQYTTIELSNDGTAYVNNYTDDGQGGWMQIDGYQLLRMEDIKNDQNDIMASGIIDGGDNVLRVDPDNDGTTQVGTYETGMYDEPTFTRQRYLVSSTNISKMVKITSSDYDTLVNNQEVDEDTFYIVVADPQIGE